MYLFISVICFLIGFVFFTFHESNFHRGTFSTLGYWFSPLDPVTMKRRFPLFPMIWNFYHFAGWMMLFSFYNAMFFAIYPRLMGSKTIDWFMIGAFLAFGALIINALLYGICPKKEAKK